MKATNMSCLTPEGALSGECDFLSANMYARSLFGEDALANLSIERTEAGTVAGHVRIRSKTQGIALSLGDKITMGMFSALFMYLRGSLTSWQLKRKINPLWCEAECYLEMSTIPYNRLSMLQHLFLEESILKMSYMYK